MALGLLRRVDRLPRGPPGDIVMAGEPAVRAALRREEGTEEAAAYLRRWPVASLLPMSMVVILAAALMTGD